MANIYKFARKALIFCLANNSNLKRWNKSTTDKCYLCDKKQTQLHVLSNCIVSVNEKHYTWRHNNVLKTLSTYIMQLQQHGYELYIDIDGYSNPSQLFNSFRPDAVIRKGDHFVVLELTVCFETNIKSRDYKKSKYLSLKDDINVNVNKFDLITLEITTLGFYAENKTLNKILKNHGINVERCFKKMGEVALCASYYIYTCRNKQWSNPNLREFY